MADPHGTPASELIERLRERVEARRAEGGYDGLDWLVEPVEEADPPTPVDRFLRTPRAAVRTDLLTAGSRGGLRGSLRERVASWVRASLEDWDVRSKDTDRQLREALAWTALAARDEQRAREALEARLVQTARELDERDEEHATALRALVHAVQLALEARVADLARGLSDHRAEVDGRLVALERARRAERLTELGPAQGPAAQPGAPAPVDFDYLAFEDRFRGPEDLIGDRQRHHLPRFAGRRRVADLGCGRGEFLELLAREGVEAVGVDTDAEMVAECRRKGLQVEHADLLDYLAERGPGTLDGIMCSHVVEHMPFAAQVRLARLAAAALAPGGVIVIETPNVLSLVAGSINFHRDPSHVRPVHPETLAFILESEGLEDVEIEPLSPTPPEHGLPRVTPGEGDLGVLGHELNAALDDLDALLHGHQDVAVTGRSPA